MATVSPRGSEWRKWDLHAHSPASHGYHGSWEQFEEQLKNAECAVVGINDYVSVQGYKRTKQRIESGDLDLGGKVILPVVEFRMRDVLKNRHNDHGVNINFHVVFDPSIPPTKIETFLRSIEVDGRQVADRYEDARFLLETVRVYLEKDVVEKLRDNPDFKDKFLVLLPYDEYGGIDDIDPDTDDWIKRGFVRNAHILGSSSKNQIDFFLWRSPRNDKGEDKFSREEFAQWFVKKKPCVKGSDSHAHGYPLGKLRDSASEPSNRFCWLKAEPTFEGLKQIVFDPESRVFIGEHRPVEPTNVIETITFNVPATAKVSVEQNDGSRKEEPFCFAGVSGTYSLSPYFNCFIGGRGSGKSTILNFLGQHAIDPASSKAFWGRLKPTFDTGDVALFAFTGVERFEFIGQSEVESFATNKQAFTNAIYERADLLSEGKLLHTEANLRKRIAALGDFGTTVEEIRTLAGEQVRQVKERKTLEQSKRTIESKEYADVVALITQRSTELQELRSWRKTVGTLRDSLQNTVQEFLVGEEEGDTEREVGPQPAKSSERYQASYAAALQTVEKAIAILEEQQFVEPLEKEGVLETEIEQHEGRLSTLLEQAGLSNENIIQARGATQQIVRIDDEMKRRQRQIDDMRSTLSTYDAVLADVGELRSEYEKLLDDAIRPLTKVLEGQASNADSDDIKSIGLAYRFDDARAWRDVAEVTYQRCAAEAGEATRSDMLKDYIIKNRTVFAGEQAEIAEKLKNAEGDAGYLRLLRSMFSDDLTFQEFRVIRDTRLNDVGSYKRIQVLYDGRDIESASFGQKCAAVMVILLLFGNNPLIIDEPEAHLDSALVANYLVPLIKSGKTNRQILFATHNANFVVNGDAEKIFILSNAGRTEITQTVIEDLDNREKLLKLEGGREAFKKRGEKLQIQ